MENEQQFYKDFLLHPGKIAILGASTNPSKAGNFVPRYLQAHGFKIIPINPMTDEILGEKTIASLEELNDEVKAIIIYRNQEAAEELAIQSIDRGIPIVWLPDGITSEKAKQHAEEKNIIFVQDRCPKREGERLGI